ncbi:MAG: ribonuclease P protein component [bacterium]
MISKNNRITKDKEFEKIFKTGRSSYNKTTGMKASSNDLGVSRVGIIVSNKVSKSAVIRNKIKRRIRYVMEKKIKEIKNKDIVIITFPATVEKSFDEIKQSIEENLEKLRLF